MNSGHRFKGQKLDVAQSSSAAQNVHFPGLPQTKLESDSIDSERFFFCEAFPSLEPASGGAPRAESVDRRRLVWETLRGMRWAKTLPDFLKRICNKLGGEVRLLRTARRVPLAPLNVDVRRPACPS